MAIRFGLRSKLLLLSSFLVTIPWFGYQYVWEMEKYLRFGQEQTILGTARALATALHERPNLFNNQASFLPSVEKGKDLYSYPLSQPINLDGQHFDWPDYLNKAHYYGASNVLYDQSKENNLSLNYTAAVGKYDKYLYFYLSVVDDTVVFRNQNAISVLLNDRVELAFISPNGEFQRYVISNKSAGWLDAFHLKANEKYPSRAPFIQGKWLNTNQGYNIELRIPLDNISDTLAFAVHDVDQPFSETITTIASADTTSADTLGTILVPSPEIERIVKGMRYTQSSIWVVDQHNRVLARAGDITNAEGLWHKTSGIADQNEWHSKISKWLTPLFETLLTQPPKYFVDQLYDAQNLTGEHIESALLGTPESQWRLSADKKAVILTAAHPIYINNQVKGAVIVEETNNGIRTVRNQALEKLFTSILAIMLFGILAFFFFASRITNRIRSLRNQAEQAIDEHGRIKTLVPAATTNDEIGDLSRSFSTAVSRLNQYNQYLENMSSRLSHELRTPIAIVRTSLENLSLQPLPETTTTTVERAQGGLTRLNLILTNMSEATNLAQMLKNTDYTTFDIIKVLEGCLQGYQQIYTQHDINFHNTIDSANINGSPEHIAQLLDKVFSNAVEFSIDQQITVSTAIKQQKFYLYVSNNGEHLPQAMAERLFDSMVSIRENRQEPEQDKRPHLGLGLYIARLICEFHQGTIKASDHHNPAGVTITIELPIID
ncbi:proteobacterial dedicated sortase system histidine kinase [Thalassotalea hakodatensis]|uniref:proteobacterial dedicated sortase system histidine kinase n=1 Tax=Thalassotalea hakodatensis TaxID=3030492 RepID=UPI002573EFFF|nr:proteobacterial dedicated sortase system histidine kinase [Thalassotalea hakodatensis]